MHALECSIELLNTATLWFINWQVTCCSTTKLRRDSGRVTCLYVCTVPRNDPKLCIKLSFAVPAQFHTALQYRVMFSGCFYLPPPINYEIIRTSIKIFTDFMFLGSTQILKFLQSYWRLSEIPRGKRLSSFNVESWIVWGSHKKLLLREIFWTL